MRIMMLWRSLDVNSKLRIFGDFNIFSQHDFLHSLREENWLVGGINDEVFTINLILA